MKHRTRRALVLAALCLPVLLAGCGGGGSAKPETGGLALTIRWPEPSRLIPAASNSIRATLTQGETPVGTRLLQRPAQPPWTTTVTFEELAPGELALSAAAFPSADGTGVAQASGAAPATIVAGQTTIVTVTMNSTIARLEITPPNPSVTVGARVQLTATAFNAAGEVVLVSPALVQWSSASPASASVAPTGITTDASGIAAGTAQITATEAESGKSAATQLTVAGPPPASFIPHPTAAAVDASGQYLFLTEQGDVFLGGTYKGAVQRYRIQADGRLALLSPSVTGDLDRPNGIVAHPTQPYIYVADQFRVYQYRVGGDGTLSPLSPATVSVSRGLPITITIDPTGQWVATHSKAGAIADSPVDLFRVGSDGTLTRTGTGVSGADIAGNVALTGERAGGRLVFASRLASFGGGIDVSGVFTMRIPPSGVPEAFRSMLVPRGYGMALDRTSAFLYVTATAPGTTSARVLSFLITDAGSHTPIAGEQPVGANTSQFPRSILSTPANTFLYVQNFVENSISQFRINADGTLAPLAPATAAAPNPALMAVHPSGQFLYVPNYKGRDATAVTAFRINADGTLAAL